MSSRTSRRSMKHMTNEHSDASSASHIANTPNEGEAAYKHRARLIFDPFELHYDFGGDHPFQSHRIVALMDLLESSGLWRSDDQRQRLALRAATLEELALIHTTD